MTVTIGPSEAWIVTLSKTAVRSSDMLAGGRDSIWCDSPKEVSGRDTISSTDLCSALPWVSLVSPTNISMLLLGVVLVLLA